MFPDTVYALVFLVAVVMHVQTSLFCSKTPLFWYFVRVGYTKNPTRCAVCFYAIFTSKWSKFSTARIWRLPSCRAHHLWPSTHTRLNLYHMFVHLLSFELADVWILDPNIQCKNCCFSQRVSLFEATSGLSPSRLHQHLHITADGIFPSLYNLYYSQVSYTLLCRLSILVFMYL